MHNTPFRALFLVRDSLDHVDVVPLTGVQAADEPPLGGALTGRSALLSFVREIGFDSVVESYQVSDLPDTSFLYTFHKMSSPEDILEILSERLDPPIRETHRVIRSSQTSAPEQLTLSPREAFQLGASELSAADGVSRVAAWFTARSGSSPEARAS